MELELCQLRQQHLKCRGEWVFVEKEKQQAKKDFEKLKELEKEGAKEQEKHTYVRLAIIIYCQILALL